MKTKHIAVYRTLDKSIKKMFPELRKCLSATEASKVMFGVQGMTRFITVDAAERNAIMALFAGNPSDMIAWSKHVDITVHSGYSKHYNSYGRNEYHQDTFFDFYATGEHVDGYKLLVKTLGTEIAASMTQDRDFADIVTGVRFLKADKLLWAKFENQIIEAFPMFPKACTRAKMVHDFAVDAMKAQERKLERKANKGMPVQPTLPQPSFTMPSVPEYQILVPQTERDLRAIGNAQNHCVGTKGMGYAQKVKHGQVWIFAVYKQGLGDGLCVEMDRHTGQVLQAQGRLRRAPDATEWQAIHALQASATGKPASSFASEIEYHW